MSDAKRTKGSSTRRSAGKSAVAVLETSAEPSGGFDDLDDILGEITGLDQVTPVDSLDDILEAIAGPAKTEAADPFDDILSELAGPAPAQPADDFDDILSEFAGPALAPTAAAEGFDDILSEIAGPAPAAPSASLDAILGEVVAPAGTAAASDKPQGGRKRAAKSGPTEESDDLSEMLDAVAPLPAEAQDGAATVPDKPGIAAKARRVTGSAMRPLRGTREISGKAYFGLLGLVGLFGLTAIGEGAVLVMAPAPAVHAPGPAHHGGPAPAAVVPLLPVDYSKIDLHRYRDKVRSLGEGGRDMLRNPAIKKAILELDNGEELYDELRALARGSAAADIVLIRNDRLTIASCNTPVCGDKAFKLAYDLRREDASVCVTEKYLNGSYLSYSYGPEGYSEQPNCNGAG
ncbi:MAG: hypothetical protein JF595_02595 [Sphingomonadales bacterium]|nr:hypothetical protein [Sphingomonadales bacterium]